MAKALLMASLVILAQGGLGAQAGTAVGGAIDGILDTVDNLVEAANGFGQDLGQGVRSTVESVVPGDGAMPALGGGSSLDEKQNKTDSAANHLESYVNSHNTSWKYVEAANLTDYAPMQLTVETEEGEVVRNYTVQFNESSENVTITQGVPTNATTHWTGTYEDVVWLHQSATDGNVSTSEDVRILDIWGSVECSSPQDGVCKKARKDIENAAYRFFKA